MKKLLLSIIVILGLSLPSSAMIVGYSRVTSSSTANDFSADTTCYALWRFESGALTTDSKGGNTLVSLGTPIADTVDYKEGAASVGLSAATPDYYTITDTSLDTGFPLKSSDTNLTFTITARIKLSSSALSRIIKKADSISTLINATQNIDFAIFNGTAWEEKITTNSISLNTWYFVAFSYDGNTTKNYRLYVYNLDTSILLEDQTGVFTNNIVTSSFKLATGADDLGANSWSGNMDEIVIFNTAKSLTDIEKIRDQVYP